MFLGCCINTQSFARNKSSSISQFIKGKSRDLKKWLFCLSGIMTSTFKVGTVLNSCDLLYFQTVEVAVVFFMLPLFYSQMIYAVKHCHDTINFISIIIPQIYCQHRSITAVFEQIIRRHGYIKIFSIVHQFVVNS